MTLRLRKPYRCELEIIFTKNLHALLKDKLNAKVNVVVENTTLKIIIYDIYNHKFVRYFYNFYEEVIHGLTAEYVSHIVLKEYRQEILKLYFK